MRLVDDGSYVIRSVGLDWTVEPGAVDDPDVLVTTTKDAWVRFLARPPAARSAESPGVEISGDRRAIRTFLRAIEVFPSG